MLNVRVLFIFLFELIHLEKNMKSNQRSRALVFENYLSAYPKV